MFLTSLELIADPRPDLWRLGAPLVWCDPLFGRLEVPAALHDWLYGSTAGRAKHKEFADHFLRAGLLAEGASKPVAQTFYLAVHWFGGSSWANDGNRLGQP